MPPFIRTLLQAVVGLIVIAVIWFVAAIVVDDPLRLPAPTIVFAKTVELATSGEYLRHATESLTVLLFGLLPALVAGIVIGFLARVEGMRWVLGPLIVVLAATPVFALYPLLVIWGGLTFVPKAILVFVAAAFPIMNAIMMHSPPRPARDAAPPDDNFGEVQPRRAAIAMLSGLRLGVILGVAALILSEFMAASRGAAFLITNSSAMFDTPTMLAAVLLIAVPTILVVAILQAIEEQIAG